MAGDLARSVATVETASARRYVGQLAKHFAHKIEVETGENHAVLRFECGTCWMRAEEGRLDLMVESPDLDQRAETEAVVERHLMVFAFRETLEPLAWRPA